MLGRILNSEQTLAPADDLKFFSLHLEMLGRREIHSNSFSWQWTSWIFIVNIHCLPVVFTIFCGSFLKFSRKDLQMCPGSAGVAPQECCPLRRNTCAMNRTTNLFFGHESLQQKTVTAAEPWGCHRGYKCLVPPLSALWSKGTPGWEWGASWLSWHSSPDPNQDSHLGSSVPTVVIQD